MSALAEVIPTPPPVDPPPPEAATFELGAARAMIGRRLLLRRRLLGFEPGTPCRVQCVVDFGDGLHLWVTTADEQQADVDQIDVEDLARYFILLDGPAPASVSRAARAAAKQAEALRAQANGPAVEAGETLGRGLRRGVVALRRVFAGVLDSWTTAVEARHLVQTARNAAAMESAVNSIRSRVCGAA